VSLNFFTFEGKGLMDERQELFVNAFPETIGLPSSSVQHYQWKFYDFPYAGVAQYGVRLENRLVGYYAALPYRYRLGGQKIQNFGMVCDVMTHSQARGCGIFTKLGAYALSEMEEKLNAPIVTGFPVRPEVIPGHLKVGWKVLFDLPVYIIPFASPTKFLSGAFLFLRPIATLFFFLYRSLVSAFLWTLSSSKFHLKMSKVNGEFFDRRDVKNFYKEANPGVFIQLERESDFLQWRFSAPEVSYAAIEIFEGEKIESILLCRNTELKEVASLAILDFSTSKEFRSIRSNFAVWKAFGLLYKKRRFAFVAAMTNPSTAKRLALLSLSFLKSPLSFKFISRGFSSLGEPVERRFLKEDSWHLMWLDSDDL